MTQHGTFWWNDLMSDDAAVSKAFYGELFGWTADDMPGPSGPYSVMSADESRAAGLYGMHPDWKAERATPHWLAYVAVEDVDAAAAKVESLGGTILEPLTDIPGVGRMCIIAGPEGARLGLITPLPELW